MPYDPSNAVVYLAMRRDDIELAIGTGVLYRHRGKYFIVTAWHNVTGRHSTTLECLCPKLAYPNNIIAYISCNLVNGATNWYVRRGFTIPLECESHSLYLIHEQQWPRIDVVAIPIDIDRPYDNEMEFSSGEKKVVQWSMRFDADDPALSSNIKCIQDYETAIANIQVDFTAQLEASDDLYILGYPKNIIDYTVQPIWKRATVATSPRLGWDRQKKFLVDCASREGMSGAPTIFYKRGGSVQVGNTTYVGLGPVAFFHGVYTSRLGKATEFEAQIGTVWQRSVVDEIIEGEIFAPLPDQVEAMPAEIRDVILTSWPESLDFSASVLRNRHQQGYFTYELMTKLGGRSNPDYVKKTMLEIAQEKLGGNPSLS